MHSSIVVYLAGNYEELAMGGGQQETAIHMLRTAAKNGSWLCLKNLHLVIAWLPSLEKELSSLEPNKDFRLWLTSEAHNSFPSILLQQSLKATFESPPGRPRSLISQHHIHLSLFFLMTLLFPYSASLPSSPLSSPPHIFITTLFRFITSHHRNQEKSSTDV